MRLETLLCVYLSSNSYVSPMMYPNTPLENLQVTYNSNNHVFFFYSLVLDILRSKQTLNL